MDISKVVYRERTRDELLGALQAILDALWGRRHNGHVWTIPADELRDADCIIVDGINELEKLREENKALREENKALREELVELRNREAGKELEKAL